MSRYPDFSELPRRCIF